MKILITEEQYNFLITESTGNKTVDQFIKYAKKRIKINDPVDIKLQDKKTKIRTTGVYRYGDEVKSKTPEIRIYTKNRLMADVIRTIGHELEHHKQNQDDMFPKGTKKKLQKKEADSNVEAGKLTFDFGKKHPEIYKTPFEKKKK